MSLSTAVAARERLTDQEAAILRSWMSGNPVTDIARAHKTDQAGIGRTIDRLCNYNRSLGRQVLDAGWYEPFTPAPPAPKTLLKPVPARLVSPPPPPSVVEPVEEVPVKSTAVLDALTAPEPDPVDDPEEDEPEPVDNDAVREQEPEPEPVAPLTMSADKILARATDVGTREIRTQVALIRRQLAELVTLLDQVEIHTAARKLVEQKERELEAAKERLRAVTGTPNPAKVRAWARKNGMYCHPHGTPSRQIIELYKAALMRETQP